MKYLFVIAIFACVAAYIYWRLRPYLKMAGRMLGMLREVRRMNTNTPPVGFSQSTQRQAGTQAADESLVRCSVCQTWLPSSRAVKLRGSNNTYCSHECLERAAAQPFPRRSAS
ncbi:MAG: hypothetical protein WCD76_04480 [Pyrinomonadaceae bacterium]